MSAGEIAWRIRAVIRDAVDRVRIPLKLYPAGTASGRSSVTREPAFGLCDVEPGEWLGTSCPREKRWLRELISRADRICEHRFDLFDLQDVFLGNPIDWNRDHSSHVAAPMVFASSIDYRDFRVTGDCKLVWEPSRHHQLVVLGRAYRATGDEKYAQEVVSQLESWIEQNPVGYGMNWRSPLELAIRMINWVWAIDFIRGSKALTPAIYDRVTRLVRIHLWDISRKFSRGSSANNHLIGEAAGVFIASSYFHELKGASRFQQASREILLREIHAQTYSDGGNREQAFGYHLFVLQFFLFAGLMARASGRDFPKSYWEQVHAMLRFAGSVTEGGASANYGDADDGYVLDLGHGPDDVRGLLASGAVLFHSSELAMWAGEWQQMPQWLLGREAEPAYQALRREVMPRKRVAKALTAAGYYLLQCGTEAQASGMRVLFDCGELGFGAIAAHGHADALSFTLEAFGRPVLVDSGTYDYFTYPAWRNYFRSTAAHNTAVVDGQDQSEMVGSFLWHKRAQARCLEFVENPGGRIVVLGEHDGYTRLKDPVIHRRRLELDPHALTLHVEDEFVCAGEHEVRLSFHLAPEVAVLRQARQGWQLEIEGAEVLVAVDENLTLETCAGTESPGPGWVSSGYHRKRKTSVLIAKGSIRGTSRFTTTFAFRAAERLSEEESRAGLAFMCPGR
jgi:hypothetical protein